MELNQIIFSAQNNLRETAYLLCKLEQEDKWGDLLSCARSLYADACKFLRSVDPVGAEEFIKATYNPSGEQTKQIVATFSDINENRKSSVVVTMEVHEDVSRIKLSHSETPSCYVSMIDVELSDDQVKLYLHLPDWAEIKASSAAEAENDLFHEDATTTTLIYGWTALGKEIARKLSNTEH